MRVIRNDVNRGISVLEVYIEYCKDIIIKIQNKYFIFPVVVRCNERL